MVGKSFRKILIANRGEIALRILRACRDMGIATVAVYSDADTNSLPVRLADEAVRIGPPSSSESYLQINRIIEAARRTGAEAVHPGYGFLSENADFAEACELSGLVFIGPPSEVIRRMGLKTAARKIMAEAGIPVVPGYDGDEQDPESLRRRINEIGFPVLIKAAAGGGGKGMRVVRSDAGVGEAIEGARREAERSFGNGTLLLEKYIEKARHIEFQICGDTHGNLVHLFERECSIQRRHQKIIEESPSPFLTPELRARMGEAAVKAGRIIGYINAGTVEFIVAPSGEFYFLEVNTRLQVEHPVTEMITGLDLVRLQIEVAEGKPIYFDQQLLRQTGHAMEARLYAEDPDNDFLPSSGTIHDWHFPLQGPGYRLDAAIESGTEVGIYYDPLLAKVIAHAPDREAAIRKLGFALKQLTVQGIQTNREFLVCLLEHPDFHRGRLHTGFIDEHIDRLRTERAPALDLSSAIAVALYLVKSRQSAGQSLPKVPPGFRNNPYRDPSMKLQIGEDLYEIVYRQTGDESYGISCGSQQVEARVLSFNPGQIRLSLDGLQRLFRIARAAERFFVTSSLGSCVVERLERYPQSGSHSESDSASAPMPGQVLRVLVTEGQAVTRGESLVVLEAMKMEFILKAPIDGLIEIVFVKVGDFVGPGAPLVKVSGLDQATK